MTMKERALRLQENEANAEAYEPQTVYVLGLEHHEDDPGTVEVSAVFSSLEKAVRYVEQRLDDEKLLKRQKKLPTDGNIVAYWTHKHESWGYQIEAFEVV